MIPDDKIFAALNGQQGQRASFKQLVQALNLRGGERNDLARRLNAMVQRRQLREIGDQYALFQPKNAVAGRLSMHRDGFGFVIPEDEKLAHEIEGDIYINQHAIGDAMHGDRVLVELGARRGGRAEGRILKVLDRAHSTVVGTFHHGQRFNYVHPIDEKISADIVIPPGDEVPQKQQVTEAGGESRHRVIGREAKVSHFEDLEGVVVDVEITAWPSPTQQPRGRVIEVLGYEDDFGVDVEIMIRKHHIPHVFPAAVLQQAESFTNTIPPAEVQRRRDYRALPIVTIDGETARDFDDAVLVRELPNRHYELQVHIADVAHYVRPGAPIDREAHLRGTSVYFPDRAVPMLPMELSTDICSLRPHLDRLVMSCIMEIDRQGEVVSYDIHEGIIRSAERMTYTNVQAVLDGDKAMRERYAALIPEFERMKTLAEILNRKRERRGSIDFDLPEPIIDFDEQGMMRGIVKSERRFANRLIEEFMLAANECVAEFLETRDIASLYRIHEQPDPKKVYEFEMLATSFGYSLGVGALPVRRVQLHADKRSRHGSGRNPRTIEIPEKVHITPKMYQKLTEQIAGKPEERILSFLMLRSLKQARYSEHNEGHFALAAPTYTHFTSPIRRYPDLIIHRLLKGVLAGEHESKTRGSHSEKNTKHDDARTQHAAGSPWTKRGVKKGEKKGEKPDSRDVHLKQIIPLAELKEIAATSSETERRAEEAERELIEWKKLNFMRDRVGEEFDGLIISVTKFGFFVELTDMFIEGLVPLTTLTWDRFTFRENTRQIIGERTRTTFSIGDRAHVILDRIDRMQRKLQFAVEPPPLPKLEKKRKKAR